MSVAEPNTQALILQAALQEFHQNGLKGARTTRIAAMAGISRTMLHYYFSTKQALYEAVLNKTFGAVLPHFIRIVGEEQDVFKLLEQVVDAIADMLEENPGLPSFIVNILNENPQMLLNMTEFQGENSPGMLDQALAKAREQQLIRQEVNGEDLLINIWAMCAMPYLLGPYISVKEGRDEAAMRSFIRNRRKSILDLVVAGIKP